MGRQVSVIDATAASQARLRVRFRALVATIEAAGSTNRGDGGRTWISLGLLETGELQRVFLVLEPARRRVTLHGGAYGFSPVLGFTAPVLEEVGIDLPGAEGTFALYVTPARLESLITAATAAGARAA